MSFNSNEFIKMLRDPSSLTSDKWKDVSSGFEGWKRNRLAGLAKQEREAKDWYANFTSQARDELTQTVGKMKSDVGRNAIARGISRSTIPGTIIGAETERLNEEYKKQDETAKSELNKTVKAIKKNRENLYETITNWDAGTQTVQEWFANNKTSANDIKSQGSSYQSPDADYNALAVMSAANVQDSIMSQKKKSLDEQQADVNEHFLSWAKQAYGYDLSGINPNSDTDTLGDRLYWGLKNEYNFIYSTLMSDYLNENHQISDNFDYKEEFKNKNLFNYDELTKYIDDENEKIKNYKEPPKVNLPKLAQVGLQNLVQSYIHDPFGTVNGMGGLLNEQIKQSGLDRQTVDALVQQGKQLAGFGVQIGQQIFRQTLGQPTPQQVAFQAMMKEMRESVTDPSKSLMGRMVTGSAQPAYYLPLSKTKGKPKKEPILNIDSFLPKPKNRLVSTSNPNPGEGGWYLPDPSKMQPESTYPMLKPFGEDAAEIDQILIDKGYSVKGMGNLPITEVVDPADLPEWINTPDGLKVKIIKTPYGTKLEIPGAVPFNLPIIDDKTGRLIKPEPKSYARKMQSSAPKNLQQKYSADEYFFDSYKAAIEKEFRRVFPNGMDGGFGGIAENQLTPAYVASIYNNPKMKALYVEFLDGLAKSSGLGDADIKRIKQAICDSYINLQPGQIRPFYAGLHDADIVEETPRMKQAHEELNKIYYSLWEPYTPWKLKFAYSSEDIQKMQEFLNIIKQEELAQKKAYEQKYHHALPDASDDVSLSVLLPWVNNSLMAGMKEFASTVTFSGIDALGRSFDPTWDELWSRIQGVHRTATNVGGFVGMALPMGPLEFGSELVLKGTAKAAARAGERVALEEGGRILLGSGVKTAEETAGKFVFRGIAPGLEAAHPLLFTGAKGAMSFGAYNAITAVVNGEPAGQVALKAIEGGFEGFGLNILGSVVFKGVKRAWSSLTKVEKVEALTEALQKGADDPKVVKSIKNSFADTVLGLKTSVKNGLQTAKGGLQDAVKNAKSWLKPGSSESSLAKTVDIRANIKEPFIVGRSGRISKLNAGKVTEAIKANGYTLADGEIVELKIVNGKAVEARLYNDSYIKDITAKPIKGTNYRVYQYESVSTGKQGSLYTDITKKVDQQAHLSANNFESSVKTAGNEGERGEYISSNLNGEKVSEGTGKVISSKTYTPVEYKGTVIVDGKVRDVSRRVYQRNDIDIYYFDKESGKTNLELMLKGRPPIGKDGKPIELHHTIQMEVGPMVEIRELTHQEYTSQLHGLVEDGASFRNDPVLEMQYNNFRRQYWKWRANQILGGMKDVR